MAKQQIPVIIVAGFLGSGKTTLLNHLLATAGGTRIGVLVNDFGSINIDALTVASQVDSTISLSNGCLCCAVDPSDLDDMLGRLAKASANIDVIVIEASGLAEPQSMVKLVLASEHPRLTYGGLVLVVDAAEFPATSTRHPELAKHLRLADLVVLNKTDRCGDLPAVRAAITPDAPVVETTHGRVDPALLFDTRPRTPTIGQLSFEDLTEGHHDHVHALYDSVEFEVDTPLHPREFLRFLSERPTGLYRVKGFVDFGTSDRYVLHTVGDHLSLDRTPWPRGIPRATRLVMIGTDLTPARIVDALTACTTTEPVDPRALLDVTRFLRT